MFRLKDASTNQSNKTGKKKKSGKRSVFVLTMSKMEEFLAILENPEEEVVPFLFAKKDPSLLRSVCSELFQYIERLSKSPNKGGNGNGNGNGSDGNDGNDDNDDDNNDDDDNNYDPDREAMEEANRL